MTSSAAAAISGLRRSIGPGILLAGACIGGSHLMSSTTAGARFGFALVGLILITNLIKYPFLRVGSRFTAATGLSLLEGFQQRNRTYLPLYLLVSLFTGTFTIAAVSFVAGLLLTNVPVLAQFDPFCPGDCRAGWLRIDPAHGPLQGSRSALEAAGGSPHPAHRSGGVVAAGAGACRGCGVQLAGGRSIALADG